MHDADLSHEQTTAIPSAQDPTAACWACGGASAPDGRYKRARLWRCGACGFRFLPLASQAAAKELYTASYFADYSPTGGYDEQAAHRRHEAGVRGELLARHAAAPGRLLEIGCASGWFLQEATRRGFAARGVEPGREQAELAARRTGLPVFGGTIEEADLDEGALDVVCGWHVLEHVVDPATALARLRGALAPGGLLLLEVPNVDSRMAQRFGESWLHFDLPHHVGHYAPRSLRTILERTGFAVEALETVSAWAYALPRQAFGPRALAAQARDRAVAGAPLRRPHPWRHELLRAVARVPA
jgi:SAM-dependent methyltransferase